MAHHDVVENNPKKETLTAILGLVPLIIIIAGIAVFAWLRPAGDHYPSTPAGEAVAETAVAKEATAQAAPATTAEAAAPAEAQPAAAEATAESTTSEATATAEAPAEAKSEDTTKK